MNKPSTKKSILKTIDLFNKPFSFNTDGGTFETNAGGVMTIAFFFISLVLTWYFGKDIYEKDAPLFFTSYDLLSAPPVLKPYLYGINNHTGIFHAFRIKFDNGTTMDNPKFIEYAACVHTKTYDAVNNIFLDKYKETPIRRCTQQHFNNPAIFELYGLNDFYCNDYENDQSIGGDVDLSIDRKYVKFYSYAKLCDNDTEKRHNLKCGTKEELNDYLGTDKIYVEVIYQNNLVHPEVADYNYIETFFQMEDGLNIFENNMAHYIELYYNLANVNRDDGLIFETVSQFNFTEFEQLKSSEQPPRRNIIDDYFFKLLVQTGRTYNKYDIAYVKIPDIIAAVGGFLSLFSYFIRLFFNIYLDNEFTVYLYKHLFAFKISEDEFEDHKVKSIELTKLKSLEVQEKLENNPEASEFRRIHSLKNPISSPTTFKSNTHDIINEIKNKKKSYQVKQSENQMFNKDLTKLIEFKKRKRREIQIDTCERFCYVYFPGKYKEKVNTKIRSQLVQHADEKIAKRLEIFELWKNHDQLRLITKIILNENQTFMINNRQLQMLSSDELESGFEKNPQEKLKEYLKEKKEKSRLSLVDQLLFKYLQEDIQAKVEQELGNLE